MLLRKIKGIISVFSVCLVFTLVAGYSTQWGLYQSTDGKEIDFIIDAGHGMPDGGAVAADGTTEQQLNLAIAQKLHAALNKNGAGTLMIREDESSVYSEGESIHAKKVSDIKNRVKLAKEFPDIPLISIHMNSYPDESVYGLQVFYKSGDEVSKKIATDIQTAINEKIQPQNPKTIKTISPNVYLFSHIENPSILIECGFLSNPKELNDLKSAEYQDKLANVIADCLVS